MGRRWGVGPVFAYEWCQAARRWQLYALRATLVALLGVGLALVWWSKFSTEAPRLRTLADAGESFFYALVGIQLSLVLLAAPAYTAGAFCVDRDRGTLLQLFATDLSNAEIVLGKLAARVLPVVGLVLAGVPVLFLAILLGGIAPEAALGAVLVTLGTGVVCCALALTLSVWGRQTHEVVLAVYLLIALWLLTQPTWSLISWGWGVAAPPLWLRWIDPFDNAFLPYLLPGTDALPWQAGYLGATLLVAGALALLAVARVRAVTLRQANRPAGAARPWRLARRLRLAPRWFPGPSLDGNPVLWREWHRRRPSRGLRVVWTIYALVALFFTLFAVQQSLGPAGRGALSAWVNALQVAFGLLLVTTTAVTALADERSRGTLDVLLTTPLSTKAIVWGKWAGAYRTVPWLAVLPVFLVVPLMDGPWGLLGVLLLLGVVLIYGASLTSLGLALATWIRRPVPALVLAVVLYVLLTVGWVYLVLVLFGISPRVEGIASASPFFAAGGSTALADRHTMMPNNFEYGCWVGFWLGIHLLTALVLLALTLRTFNRCVGRVGNRARPRRRATSPTAVPETPILGRSG
jgi:ABC-type transport system involved in multi-copper enzyme maturation permease subunit